MTRIPLRQAFLKRNRWFARYAGLNRKGARCVALIEKSTHPGHSGFLGQAVYGMEVRSHPVVR
jgi:hypothetical protein